jgi:hypothetical protein
LPDENAMQIRERIIRSADRYSDPDTEQYGYGIPDAWLAYTMQLPLGIENVGIQDNGPESRKILKDGRLLIIRQGKAYNMAGQRME